MRSSQSSLKRGSDDIANQPAFAPVLSDEFLYGLLSFPAAPETACATIVEYEMFIGTHDSMGKRMECHDARQLSVALLHEYPVGVGRFGPHFS